jgi:hypothetical protein
MGAKGAASTGPVALQARLKYLVSSAVDVAHGDAGGSITPARGS